MFNLREIKDFFGPKQELFKKILLALILFPFTVIYIQQLKPVISLKPLKGYFIAKVYSPFEIKNWFNGEYQQTTESYVNDEFGFRTVLLRTNNQIKFWLFNKTTAEGVIIGKENYLYEKAYIDAYNGLFFMGDRALNDTISKLKTLQDTLKSLGKELLIVMAPSKVRVYPEFVPEEMINKNPKQTNYDYLSEHFKKAGIQYIDFNVIFQKKKKSSPFLLFPQLGVHWSRMEAVHAADTMLNYLASVSKTNLPRIVISKTYMSDTLQSPDNDIIEGMNTLIYPQFKKMEYPEIEIDTRDRVKKNAIVVADSYWWDIYSRDIPKRVFKNNEFWYYNMELFGNNFLGKTDPKTVDIKRHILFSDYIIILCTETNLSRLGFGFIGNAISALRSPIQSTEAELNSIITVIKNTPHWFKDVQDKAQKEKRTLENQLKLDADWYFQKRGPISLEIPLNDIKASIKLDEKWYDEVIQKAKDRKISVDSMMTIDAIWFKENVLNYNPQKKPLSDMEKTKELIIHNPTWMKEIREKAKDRNISVDSMITLDAIWYMDRN